nr:low-density lipoprotein receptor-related protein 1B [Bactrocera oleae]
MVKERVTSQLLRTYCAKALIKICACDFLLIGYISLVINADEGSRCDNGEYIDDLDWCNGSVQCLDRSDELNCKETECTDSDFNVTMELLYRWKQMR